MSILSIDYGSKQIGLALSEPQHKIALPYGQIENKSEKFVLEEIKKICQQEKISKIVVGLPISLSGQKEKSAKKVLEFIEKLEIALKISVTTEDERLTSKMAQRLLTEFKNKKADHSVAAMLILQGYLDKKY